MKTTQIIKCFMVMIFLSVITPTFAVVVDPVASTPATETPEAKVARLQQRIEEIKSMDKSKLSKAERKALRKEVKNMRDEVKAVSGGIYIGLGALLVILILLLVLV